MAHGGAGRASATVALALLAACSSVPERPAEPEVVHLFDCGGWIQTIDERGVAGSALRVSEIDAELPAQVRDGCAIREGRFDRGAGVLELVVQTAALEDELGELPTRLLRLSARDLTLAAPAGSAESRANPAASDRDASALGARLEAIEGPFGRSVAYPSDDGTLVLLQEMGPGEGATMSGVRLHGLWQLGRVELRSAQDATGRYALLDVTTGSLAGGVVTAEGDPEAHRVVCFTPGGRILLAPTRDTLVILDVHAPASRTVVSESPLDLFWTACVVG